VPILNSGIGKEVVEPLSGETVVVVAKVGDALKNILEDESQIEQMKVVNDSMSPAWYL
jgi:NAD(P)-dependent dehydrogenase (short-subunit alcohol dehydrogenase family)